MDGSSLSLILIPIGAAISLAIWLILVAYAASHPVWKHGPAAPQGVHATPSPDARMPLPRNQIPRPVRQPGQPGRLAAAGHTGR
jgi:hypothetical protein